MSCVSDPVRDFMEAHKWLEVAFVPPGGATAGVQKIRCEYLGAYLRDEFIVVMVRFDDSTLEPVHLDSAYEAVRARYKDMFSKVFRDLEPGDLAMYVIDTSGNIGDFEF